MSAVDTKSLTRSVVAAVRDHGNGDAAATAALAAEARAAGAKKPMTMPAGTVTVTPLPVTPPVPTGLICPEDVILRPNGQEYHVRKIQIDKISHDDVAVLRKAREEDIPVLFYGIPGCGKTSLFEAAFADDGFEFIPGSGDTQVSDFVGGYVPLPGGGFLWVDGPLPRAMDRGVPLLVDEVALVDPKVMAVAYSVMDGRGILRITDNPERGDVKAKKGFVVMGACNPNAPGANMSEALISRFELHIEMGVDFQLMRKMGVNKKLILVVQNMKKKYETTGEIGWYPAIREMLGFLKMERVYGLETALANVVSQAPEVDRAQIADMLTRGFEMPVKGLSIR